MAQLLARIGGFSARHRWSVLIAWIVLLVIMVGAAATLSKPMSSTFNIPGLQSIKTLNKVDREFGSEGGGGNIVFAAPKGQKLAAADAATVATLSSSLAAVHGVGSAPDPFTAQVKTLSPDERIGYIPLTLVSGSGSSEKPAETASTATQKGITKAVDAARSARLQVEAASGLTIESSASSNPLVGIVIGYVILFFTFFSLLAAGLPLLTALLGLGTSVAAVTAATAFTPINSVAPTFALLLGLAVGIDYSLFIVNRHRQQVIEGMGIRDSIRLALGTAGSAVFFAALTVIIALAGLSVVNVPFLTQMGLAAAAAVFIAMLVSLTLTPALLSMAGRRVLGRRARRRMATGAQKPAGRAARSWASQVARRPIRAVVACVVVLGVLALPVLGMRLGLPNDGSQPSSTTERQAYDLMADGFGGGVNGPIVVLADYHGAVPTSLEVASVAQHLGGVADVERVIPSGVRGDSALFTVIPKSGPSAVATETLVHALRGSSALAGVSPEPSLEVTGQTAVAIDVSQRLQDALPLYLGLVAGFAFLLLLIVFRSVLIPLKATISFLLSLGATLGCTVAVFQWGWLGNVFGVDPAAPLLSFLPILVIGVLFGLSMDYEMFLVTGMREHHAQGEESHHAVVSGFGQGAKVVAAAALIMIAVFGNGEFTGSSTIKPIAFALAVGVLVDAFVVRMTLVPAVMTLFGRAAWWFPRWLERVTPHMDIEGSGLRRREAGAEPAASPTGEPVLQDAASAASPRLRD